MKLYILGPTDGEEGLYTLLMETGEGLANHWCSHNSFAMGDLEAHRPERQKRWHERFGDYTVLFVGDDEVTVEHLMRLNEAWWQSIPHPEEPQNEKEHVDITI